MHKPLIISGRHVNKIKNREECLRALSGKCALPTQDGETTEENICFGQWLQF